MSSFANDTGKHTQAKMLLSTHRQKEIKIRNEFCEVKQATVDKNKPS